MWCLHSITIGEKFGKYVRTDRIILYRIFTTNSAEIKRYCNLFKWIEPYFIKYSPKNHMHQWWVFICIIKLCSVQMFSSRISVKYGEWPLMGKILLWDLYQETVICKTYHTVRTDTIARLLTKFIHIMRYVGILMIYHG